MTVCSYHVKYAFQSDSKASLATWLNVHLRTKWLGVRVPLQQLSTKFLNKSFQVFLHHPNEDILPIAATDGMK